MNPSLPLALQPASCEPACAPHPTHSATLYTATGTVRHATVLGATYYRTTVQYTTHTQCGCRDWYTSTTQELPCSSSPLLLHNSACGHPNLAAYVMLACWPSLGPLKPDTPPRDSILSRPAPVARVNHRHAIRAESLLLPVFITVVVRLHPIPVHLLLTTSVLIRVTLEQQIPDMALISGQRQLHIAPAILGPFPPR
jgi:hypothetical protein